MLVGELSALVAAFLWAAGSFLFTAAAIKIGSIQLNIDRLSLAAILIIPTMLLFNISFDVSLNQIVYLTLSGIVGLIIGDSFLFRAFKDMGPRISLLIFSINPAIAALLAYFLFDEILSYLSILGILLTLTGIAAVVIEKPKNALAQFKVTPMGLFFAFLSAVGQATGLILAKYALMESEMHSFTATFYRISASVILMLPVALIFRRYKNPIKLYMKDFKSLQMVGVGSIIGPYLGITLSFVAISNTKIGIASTLLSTVPILILPMTMLVYKEKLSLRAVLGAVVAVGGVSLLFI